MSSTALDRRAFQRQLDSEFPNFELNNWYIQYRQLKFGCPDAVLLYRMGDFYETFDDDAKLVAEKLEITLTYKRFASDKTTKAEQRCPMAGLPYHAIERYTATLVGAGYRVAVAEQVSETASSRKDTRPKSVFAGFEQSEARKGMVDREVVRVLTPGTVTETTMLPAAQNNYLVAVIAEPERVGIAYADLSTGEFACTEFSGERAFANAQGELARLSAAEVLVPDDEKLRLPGLEPANARLTHDLEFMTKGERDMLLPGERLARRTERENTARWAHGHVTSMPTWKWELRTTYDALTQLLRVRSLDGFGLTSDKKLAIRAAGAIIQYTRETQNGALSQITGLRAYTTSQIMFLDPPTRRNLELLEGTSSGKAKGSLVGVLDQTRTPMGARLLRRWIGQPLLDIVALNVRQANVAFFADDALLRADLREKLKPLGDMERAVNRVVQGGNSAVPRDLVRLRDALRALPGIIGGLDSWSDLQPKPATQPAPDEAAFDTGDGEIDTWHDLLEAEPTPQPPAPSPQPPAPSLREQREAKQKVAARYADQEDLFADFSWDDEDGGQEPGARSQERDNSPALQRREHRTPDTGHRPTANGQRPTDTGQRPTDDEQPPTNNGQPTTNNRQPTTDNRHIDACADILAFLEQALDDEPPALLGASNYLRAVAGGEVARRVIRPGFDKNMDQVVLAAQSAQQYISNLEMVEQKKTEIKSLKVGYNQVFGYYIEIAKSYTGNVPEHYIRKQTLTTGERYITPELKEFETIVITAQERLNDLERQAFQRTCAQVGEAGTRLLATARALAEVDVYLSLAEVAARWRYVRPQLYDDTRLVIHGGRHPMVEQALEEPFIANDALLDTTTNQVLIITGPNMAGKSTALRQVALIVLMAQIGSFVPARHAEIGIVDRIFTRIGAQDDIATGQSTFMVEMTETAALLVQSSRRSLIILDEVGRGTSTYDGMAIARGIVEYIHNDPRLGCRTLFATHYHELTALDQVLPRVKNYHMAAVEKDGHVAFLHELRSGGADRSYGIHVAELAGIPRAVIKRATELLADLERGDGHRLPIIAAPVGAAIQQPTTLPHAAVEQLRRMNVNELTPIEALTKLYELQQLAKG